MPGVSNAVFLSYASEDAEAAERIATALRAAGVEVWFDKSELRGGDLWDQKIVREIHDCALFIPVVSQHTQERLEGYFRHEWKLAVERTHHMAEQKPFLVPVVIDGTGDKGAVVPDGFRAVQWTRLPGGITSAAFVDRIKRLLSPEPSPSSIAPSAAARRERLSGSQRAKPLLLAILSASALALAYLVAVKVWPSKRVAAAEQPVAATVAPSPEPAIARTVPVLEKSIAVLPFVDLSEKKDQEYFGDGMAEEILDQLSKLPQLTVIGRTSSFQFKGRSEDLREIGDKLRVAYVVEGSVRKAGPRIRVTAQLIDTASGAQVWSDSYDRDYGDVLSLQDAIATGIARALQLAIAVDDTRSTRRLRSNDAYTLYLRGLSYLDRLHKDQLVQAKDYFEQALRLDPSLLRAAEALAFTYIAISIDENIPAITAHQQARAAAQRALGMDGNSATAHSVLGYVHAYNEFEWSLANAEFDKALSINPRDPAALYLASQVAHPLGQRDVAEQRINASLALDPLNPYAQQGLGEMLRDYGDLEGSDNAFRKCLEISPTFDGSHLYLAENLLLRGQAEAALAEVRQETASDAKDLGLALVQHSLGRHAESNAALTRLVRADSELWPFAIALAYAYRGEPDDAFRWMEKAYQLRDDELIYTVRSHPMLARLRGDPRYRTLLREMNLPE